MRGPFGYGRYDDGHIGCPRAKSDMTPCVARDGRTAIDGPLVAHNADEDGSVCVGCGRDPVDLLVELVKGASAMECSAMESRRLFEGGVEREAWVVMAVFKAALDADHG